VLKTFTRMTRHLTSNSVDFTKNKLKLGTLLQIDQKKETFVNHPAANSFLTREYRAPFMVPAENEI